jgi:hypothetical protein
LLAVSASATVLWKIGRQMRNPLALGVATAFGFGALWSSRGILLSGCLVYPVATSCIRALPWTIPERVAITDVGYMATYGVPSGVEPQHFPPSLRHWFAPWIADMTSNRYVHELLVFLSIVAIFIVMRATMRDRINSAVEQYDTTERAGFLCVCLVLLGNIGVWFFGAPLPRYGEGSLVIFTGTILALSLPLPTRSAGRLRNAFAGWLAAAQAHRWATTSLIMLAFVLTFSVYEVDAQRRLFRPSKWPEIPFAPVEEASLPSGLKYDKPLNGSFICWATPQPCTYYLEPDLTESHFLWWTVIKPSSSTNVP